METGMIEILCTQRAFIKFIHMPYPIDLYGHPIREVLLFAN